MNIDTIDTKIVLFKKLHKEAESIQNARGNNSEG